MQRFSANAKIFLEFFFKFLLPTKSWKKHLKKLHTYGSWEFFFSAAQTAQNNPELHFRFINSFIQSSLLRSLGLTECYDCNWDYNCCKMHFLKGSANRFYDSPSRKQTMVSSNLQKTNKKSLFWVFPKEKMLRIVIFRSFFGENSDSKAP